MLKHKKTTIFQMSTTTPKIVMFNMEIGEAPDPSEENVDHNKLEEQIKELSQSLTGMYVMDYAEIVFWNTIFFQFLF